MTKDPKTRAKNIKIDVINPRYEGATPLMVAKALLQRPKKAAQTDDGEPGDKDAG